MALGRNSYYMLARTLTRGIHDRSQARKLDSLLPGLLEFLRHDNPNFDQEKFLRLLASELRDKGVTL